MGSVEGQSPTSSSACCVKLMDCLYCVLTRNSLSAKGWYRSTTLLMVKKLPRLLLIFSLSTAAKPDNAQTDFSWCAGRQMGSSEFST